MLQSVRVSYQANVQEYSGANYIPDFIERVFGNKEQNLSFFTKSKHFAAALSGFNKF